jgi:hypothetical protein
VTTPPQIEIVGDGELSDTAIESLARLLLDLVEQKISANATAGTSLAQATAITKGA